MAKLPSMVSFMQRAHVIVWGNSKGKVKMAEMKNWKLKLCKNQEGRGHLKKCIQYHESGIWSILNISSFAITAMSTQKRHSEYWIMEIDMPLWTKWLWQHYKNSVTQGRNSIFCQKWVGLHIIKAIILKMAKMELRLCVTDPLTSNNQFWIDLPW